MPADATPRRFNAVVAALRGRRGVSFGSDEKRSGPRKGSGARGFGSSALKVNGRIFAMISSRGAFVVKLPAQRVEALEAAGAGERFDPGHGRLMKEWLPLDAGSDLDWLALAEEALRFVRGTS